MPLCILDSGAYHADLTAEYASITDDLAAVCRCFGRQVLQEVPEDEFLNALPQVRQTAGTGQSSGLSTSISETRRALQ